MGGGTLLSLSPQRFLTKTDGNLPSPEGGAASPQRPRAAHALGSRESCGVNRAQNGGGGARGGGGGTVRAAGGRRPLPAGLPCPLRPFRACGERRALRASGNRAGGSCCLHSRCLHPSVFAPPLRCGARSRAPGAAARGSPGVFRTSGRPLPPCRGRGLPARPRAGGNGR